MICYHYRLIANSAPHMNNVILGGTILMVFTILSLSFDSNYPQSFVDGNATMAMENRNRYSSWCKVSPLHCILQGDLLELLLHCIL